MLFWRPSLRPFVCLLIAFSSSVDQSTWTGEHHPCNVILSENWKPRVYDVLTRKWWVNFKERKIPRRIPFHEYHSMSERGVQYGQLRLTTGRLLKALNPNTTSPMEALTTRATGASLLQYRSCQCVSSWRPTTRISCEVLYLETWLKTLHSQCLLVSTEKQRPRCR